jgi:hypothetical protein
MYTETLKQMWSQNNCQPEGSYHSTTSVTTQVSTQNVVPSEPQTASSGNLNVTELYPL